MKFTCSRDDLLKEISVAQEVISSKNSLSVLSNVLLTVAKGELTLQATDLKVGFETSLPVGCATRGNCHVISIAAPRQARTHVARQGPRLTLSSRGALRASRRSHRRRS